MILDSDLFFGATCIIDVSVMTCMYAWQLRKTKKKIEMGSENFNFHYSK